MALCNIHSISAAKQLALNRMHQGMHVTEYHGHPVDKLLVPSRRYKKSELGSHEVRRTDMTGLSKKVQLQLNDTHPALAIPELMRLLVDIEGLDWDTVSSSITNKKATLE